jgi:hypothetical protein
MTEVPEGKVVEIEPRFRLIPFDAVTVGSERVYLVKGLIPRTGLIVAWGPPKCGKSFWTFDLVMHIALGWEYRGRRVQQGPVVYLALEGGKGFEARIEAFRQRFLPQDADPVPFYLLSAPVNLVKDHGDVIGCIRLQAQASPPLAVVIDTLNRSLAGSESDDKGMAGYIRAADAIREAFGCAVVIVHHCGVDASRPRGHTSLTGAVDAQLAVKRDTGDNVVVEIEWMKDGPEGDIIASRLEAIEVGQDVDGDAITSCVVLPTDTFEQAKKVKLAPMPRAGLEQLHECIADLGQVRPATTHIPAGVQSVTLEQWKERLYVTGIINRDGSHREQFRRIRVTLQNSKLIGIWDDIVWSVTSRHISVT